MSVTHKLKHEKRALSTVCRTAVSSPQMTSCPQGPDTCPIRIHSWVLIFRVLAHVSWRHYTNTRSTAFSPSLPPAQWKQNLPILQMEGLMGQRDIYSSFFSYRNISGSVFALLAFLYLIVIGLSKRAFCDSSRLGLSQLYSFSHGIRSTLKTWAFRSAETAAVVAFRRPHRK